MKNMTIQKNDKLLIFEIVSGAIIYNKVSKKSYKIGCHEYSLLKDIEEEIEFDELSKKSTLDIVTIANILKDFEKAGLLMSSEIKKSNEKKHVLVYGSDYLELFSKRGVKILFDLLFYLSLPLLIASFFIVKGKIDVDAIIESVNIFHIIIMDVILAISISLHELFHAIFAKNNGAFCAEIGYKFDLFIPCAYTTICGIDEIKSKSKKIMVFYAGIGINSLIAAVSLLLMSNIELRSNMLLFMLFGCNFCLVLVNSLLFFKSDIYYIFCTMIGNVELKEETKNAIKRGCIKTENIIYICLAYIVQPIAIAMLLLTAFLKIGGKIL